MCLWVINLKLENIFIKIKNQIKENSMNNQNVNTNEANTDEAIQSMQLD